MDTKVYSQDGKLVTTYTLPEAVFGLTWNPDLVHEVVVSMQSNARAGTAHTKDRSEVRGGGRKPWKQKGTGRARHGSRRSPIWTGGGVAHGPRTDKDFTKKINKKTRSKALAVTLSKKLVDGEMVFLSALSFSEPKTALAKVMMQAVANGADMKLMQKKNNAALVVLSKRDAAIEKSFRNFGNVTVVQAKDVNPVDLLTSKYVVVADTENSVAQILSRVVRTEAE
jgi:large subunit ribosomal protein L4